MEKKNFILKFDRYIGISNSDEEFENVKWLLEDRILGHLKQKGQVLSKECLKLEEENMS